MHCSVWKRPAFPVIPWVMTFVALLTRIDIGYSLAAATTFFAASIKSVARMICKPDLAKISFSLFDIRSFHAYYKGNMNFVLFRRSSDPCCQCSAVHDASEYVYQDRFDICVREDNCESCGHFFLRGAAADIQEVRRSSSEMLE